MLCNRDAVQALKVRSVRFFLFFSLVTLKRSISNTSSPTHILTDTLRLQKTIQFIRNYLDKRDFTEVETPILSASSGGANATPFETYSSGLNTKLKLRISPELYLKQLLVGGLDRVYEIGKVFRNEGISPVHAPEFTTCEFYMTYANHKDLMSLTEDMLLNLVTHVTESSTLTLPRSMARNCVLSSSEENSSDSVQIDFSGP